MSRQSTKPGRIANLVIVLGDQLCLKSSAFDGFDAAHDMVWMAEVHGEAEHVWSTKARIAMFLSAMRHFRQTLEKKGIAVSYRQIDDPQNHKSLAAELKSAIKSLKPQRLVTVQPGEFRIEQTLVDVAKETGIALDIRPDNSFLCSRQDFDEHAAERKQLRMEFFYRYMRKRYEILMDRSKPMGGKWNFDADNRQTFSHSGPGKIPPHASFAPDSVTRQVIAAVNKQFATHPGSLDSFDYPVTPKQASKALEHFCQNHLRLFGKYQDAMWTGHPFLHHSRLSAAMNLKLLDPRTVIQAAVEAYQNNAAPLNSVEGFVRQILGWREYVRGIYWRHMPQYINMNALDAKLDLPGFYWKGNCKANCLAQAIGQTLQYGYAHHIQRLMVTGLFALLLGVKPEEVHKWYLAVYVDAVEWVELPNTLGMSQFADGGIMASKPYVATGKYIQKMSDYCDDCPFNPQQSTGQDACPFTTLYWDFLLRHDRMLRKNPRMGLQIRNIDRLNREDRKSITSQADWIRDHMDEI